MVLIPALLLLQFCFCSGAFDSCFGNFGSTTAGFSSTFFFSSTSLFFSFISSVFDNIWLIFLLIVAGSTVCGSIFIGCFAGSGLGGWEILLSIENEVLFSILLSEISFLLKEGISCGLFSLTGACWTLFSTTTGFSQLEFLLSFLQLL